MKTDSILIGYYSQNAKKLHDMVNRILRSFGKVSDKDHYYSLANEVFVEVLKEYDGESDFDNFLYSCLVNKIKSEMTKQNRLKRKADKIAVSLNEPAPGYDGAFLEDVIASDFDVFKEAFGENTDGDSKIEKYFSKLSNRQREIVKLLAECYKPKEIREKLGITEKEYADCMINIHAYNNIKILF